MVRLFGNLTPAVERAFGGRRGDGGAAERLAAEQRAAQERLVRQQAEAATLLETQRQEAAKQERLIEERRVREAEERNLQRLIEVQAHSSDVTLAELDTLESYFQSNPLTVRLANVACLIGPKGSGKTTLLYVLKVVQEPPVPSTEDQTLNVEIHGSFMDTVGISIDESTVCRFIAVLLNRGIVPKHFILVHNERVASAVRVLRSCEFNHLSFVNMDCRGSLASRELKVDSRVYVEAESSLGLSTISSVATLTNLNEQQFASCTTTEEVPFRSILKQQSGSTYGISFAPQSKLNYSVLKHLYALRTGRFQNDKDFLNGFLF